MQWPIGPFVHHAPVIAQHKSARPPARQQTESAASYPSRLHVPGGPTAAERLLPLLSFLTVRRKKGRLEHGRPSAISMRPATIRPNACECGCGRCVLLDHLLHRGRTLKLLHRDGMPQAPRERPSPALHHVRGPSAHMLAMMMSRHKSITQPGAAANQAMSSSSASGSNRTSRGTVATMVATRHRVGAPITVTIDTTTESAPWPKRPAATMSFHSRPNASAMADSHSC